MKGFVKSVVSLSLVLGLACAAEAKTVLNLDFLSNEGTAEHASTLFLKQYVENRTGGELQIDIYAGAQLCGNPIECFQSLESGVVHIYPATAGQVLRTYVNAGEYVEAGTLLFELDTEDLQTAAETARLQYVCFLFL